MDYRGKCTSDYKAVVKEFLASPVTTETVTEVYKWFGSFTTLETCQEMKARFMVELYPKVDAAFMKNLCKILADNHEILADYAVPPRPVIYTES